MRGPGHQVGEVGRWRGQGGRVPTLEDTGVEVGVGAQSGVGAGVNTPVSCMHIICSCTWKSLCSATTCRTERPWQSRFCLVGASTSSCWSSPQNIWSWLWFLGWLFSHTPCLGVILPWIRWISLGLSYNAPWCFDTTLHPALNGLYICAK